MDGFPVDMSDEITFSQSSLVCRTVLLHMPDHVMYGVDVTVPHVHTDGSQSEAVLLSGTVNENWRFEVGDGGGEVTARGGVPG